MTTTRHTAHAEPVPIRALKGRISLACELLDQLDNDNAAAVVRAVLTGHPQAARLLDEEWPAIVKQYHTPPRNYDAELAARRSREDHDD